MRRRRRRHRLTPLSLARARTVYNPPAEEINRGHKHNNYYLFIWLFAGASGVCADLGNAESETENEG